MNHLNTICGHGDFKAVSAPLLEEITLSGDLSHPVWQKVAYFDDFSCQSGAGEFKDRVAVPAKDPTQIRVFRDRKHIYFGGICFQKKVTVRPRENKDHSGAFAGDGVEIMLGYQEPEPYLVMLRLSADGGRFTSGVDFDLFEAETKITNEGWRFEIKLPLAALHAWSWKINFNFFRENTAHDEYQAFSNIDFSSHEVQPMAELLLCSYDEAMLYRLGGLPENPVSRQTYQDAVRSTALTAYYMVIPPYLAFVRKDSIDICFETAGNAAGCVEYQKAGSDVWHSVTDTPCRFHRLTLTGLEPGREYIYRAGAKARVYGGFVFEKETSFIMPPADNASEIRCTFTSDVHSSTRNLDRLLRLPAAQQADILFDCGDLSCQCTTGRLAVFQSGFDCYVRHAGGKKLIAGVCGNHDHYGFYNRHFMDMYCGNGKNGYGAFRSGPVLFILLDNGVDVQFDDREVLENIAMRNRQRQWLLELQQTDLWKETIFHVAVTHMTAYNEKYGSRELIRMLDGVFDFSPEKRLHALIGGHLHFYYAQMPGEMEFLLDMQWSDNHTAEVAVTRPPQAFPYFVMCIPAVCGLNADGRKAALLSLHATAESLELKLFSIDGKVKHAFEIDPAGKCLKRMIE